MSGLIPFVRGDDLAPGTRDGGAEIRLVGLIVLVGTAASIVFHQVVHHVTGEGWPYTTFLYHPFWRFNDYFEPYFVARMYDPPGARNVVYSPLLHLLMTALTLIPDVVGLTAMMTLFAVALVLVLWHGVTLRVGGRRLRQAYVLIFCFLAYPVLFLVDRANLDMLVFALLAGFVYLYYVCRSPWAWLPLSLAIAGKYTWLPLVLVLLADRRWRQALFSLVGAAVATLASAGAVALWRGVTVAEVLRDTGFALAGHADTGNTLRGLQHGHTFFDVFVFIDRLTDYSIQHAIDMGRLYQGVALCVLLAVAARVLLYEMPEWKKLAALVICVIALPFESHDYAMIMLFLPLALAGAYGFRSPHARLVAVLFALTMIPLDYVQFRRMVSYSSLLYPIVLASLLIVILASGVTLRAVPLWRRAVAEGDDPAATSREEGEA